MPGGSSATPLGLVSQTPIRPAGVSQQRPTVRPMTTPTADALLVDVTQPPGDVVVLLDEHRSGQQLQVPEDPSAESTVDALNAYRGPDIWVDLIWPHLEINRAATACIDIDRRDRFLDHDGHLFRYDLSIEEWVLDDELGEKIRRRTDPLNP